MKRLGMVTGSLFGYARLGWVVDGERSGLLMGKVPRSVEGVATNR